MRNLRALNIANEQITVKDSELLEPQAGEAFSLLIWFKLSGSVPTTTLIAKLDTYGYQLATSASDKLVGTVTDVNEDGSSITGGTTLAVDTWYLGILTMGTGGELNLYLNGVSDATQVLSGADAGLGDAIDLLITDANFSGQIGEIQLVIGAELSEAEALDLYNRGTSKGLKPSYNRGDVRLWLRWKNNIFKDNSGYENEISGTDVDRTDRARIKAYR